MNYTALAWMFVTIAAIFALGLTPHFARRFYPDMPHFRRRLAAPIIFGLLAAACFTGLAVPALALTAALGLTQVGRDRWRHWQAKHTA